MRIKKYIYSLEAFFIKKLIYLNGSLYMKNYIKYLKKNGMKIIGNPNYIGTDVHFDGTDYGLITINDNVTISKEVMFLTHDYSMHTVIKNLEINNKHLYNPEKGALAKVQGIYVGKNSFIGARASLLPGTKIGENVIIGACAVVKGNIPDNSVALGNPCKVICKTSDLIDKNLINKSYIYK